ncbi:ATP-binding protein [Aliikangiella marina]|uniref:ATP-binding protein n=1 Tax=Aliikangiella marina TaxID=1712262 RepID=A0A545TGT2_9GAMM|nr:ATP-binding protein [Aliikangiella marina]TQV76444.1 ATP-binding protein [Aliikangiella marina]
MDKTTLENLELAYKAAPSAELAKVIINTKADLGALSDIEAYIESCKHLLSTEELMTFCNKLCDDGEYEIPLSLLDETNSEQATLKAQCFYQIGEQDKARDLYQKLIINNQVSSNDEFVKQLGLDESTPPESNEQQGAEKPKLKLVEKTDVAEITDLIRYREDTTDFNDVVGLTDIKKQINKKIIMPFQRPSLFQRFKKKVGGGVLLYGPPGCGKTLLARATAGECNASFYNVEISDVLDMYIGESEQKLRAIFEKARAETPSVLFFDEIEALAGKREHSRNATSANLVSQFLTELDGFSQNNEGVLVLASTNVPWAVDAAFLRPGRFDRMFFVPPPDRTAREAILVHHMKDRPGEGTIDFKSIAAKASGYSGADLYNLVEMAADEAIDDSIESGEEASITYSHFELALKGARSTTVEWLTTARNYARYANDGGRYDDVLDFLKKHGK